MERGRVDDVRARARGGGAGGRGALALSSNRFCLDTSAYSHFMRGEPSAVRAIDAAGWIGVPAIVLGELHTGFLTGRQTERNEDELGRFLEHPVVQELPVDHDVARIYSEIIRDLRTKGTPLPTNDIWIAAVSARAGATLLTFDAHFSVVERIGVLRLVAIGTEVE